MAWSQPKTWEVHVGTQLHPSTKELYRTVKRDDLLDIITTFRRLVDAADELGGTIECTGD
jgi:hypothetical protein